MKIMKFFPLVALVALMLQLDSFAQQIGRGDPTGSWARTGVHNGNQVRTVFRNSGVIAQPGSDGPRGAWKFDDNGYIGDVSPLMGVRLPIKDWNKDGILDTIHSVVITPVDRPGGGKGTGGVSWTFAPIPGFLNQSYNVVGKGIAFSDNPQTWPAFWPDHPDWKDSLGKAEWNGYFGRGQIHADQESFFMMDDNMDENMFTLYGFLPDSTDNTRKGQALQVKVRGLQWANPLAENTLFWVYSVKNVGTTLYDQTVFGFLVGTYVGIEGNEYSDDVSYFDVRESMTYTWDFGNYINPIDNPRWKPNPSAVGYVGYAFLESPGNQYDGIDNDGDDNSAVKKYWNFTPDAPFFTASDFDARTVNAGDKLVKITITPSGDYVREQFTVQAGTDTVYSMGKRFVLEPGKTKLVEGNVDPSTGNLNANASDGFDNDLDGLIDENYQVDYRQFKKALKSGVVLIDQVAPVQYKEFLNSHGRQDLMIDESRNDGLDNDGDWSRDPVTGEWIYGNGKLVDDVGADGKANTHDMGEGDGVPTPGEPNFDVTDVHESDQIGLTNFQYFAPASGIHMNNNEEMWGRLRPGFFDVPEIFVNGQATRGEDGDFVYGSGYFPLLPGNTQDFSLALCYGDDFKGVLKTKQVAQIIYNANYNFPTPPDRPTLRAVAGDHKVTLYWDKVAENSIDPTTKEKDFEGYKIYKGTDPDFTDAKQISDGTGQKKGYVPLVQFDLKNNITGYFVASPQLYTLNNGMPFYLGDDSGIQNTFVDNDVENGRTYYYAVCAYDRGKAIADIFPSENNKPISKNVEGILTYTSNTLSVVPNAPVAGYVPPKNSAKLEHTLGSSTVVPYYATIDPTKIKDASYEVFFNDSTVKGVSFAYAYNVVNLSTKDTIISHNKKMLATNGDIFDGLQLSFDTRYQTLDSIKMDASKSGWNKNRPNNLGFNVTPANYSGIVSINYPYDYMLVFSDEYKDSSNKLASYGSKAVPAKTKLNFKVFDITEPANPVRVQFGFADAAGAAQDTLSKLDRIFLSDREGKTISWWITFSKDSTYVPRGGDTLFVRFTKPFTSRDKFTFTTAAASYDAALAKTQLNDVKAVPNPYIVTNTFEQPLPSQIRGRGERVINFINLPPNARINIYSSDGSHIQTLQQDGGYNSGSLSWNLRTKEGLDVAFGVYFYVVEAPGISEKKYGKIAIIK
ncbi:MAG: hypothetical protein ACM3UR_01960 [Bacteroidota bacterium]|jgi:hypothetical protein|nr:hypothetical protein [Ignavibacteria bacterium]MCU7521375.1 hypothetical protein [Ignavibacteria bacterium]MCU7524178.1 hypothetical protein [Ignavibacteria bacterium]